MTAEIIPVEEPRALAGLAAKLPTAFLPDEKTGMALWPLHRQHPQ